MATPRLSVGQGATEPKRKVKRLSWEMLNIGYGRCTKICSRQHPYNRDWQGYMGIPQSKSLARLIIGMTHGTVEILLFPKLGMINKHDKC
ncbi:MAG: hypothetical protein VZQ98_17520 [Bacteroidales bacterium]|nr:hypothetical protein [Bacteroidales bacterium]